MAAVIIPNSNDLSEIFSSILYNVSDYSRCLLETAEVYTSTLDDIDKRFFMALDFLAYSKEYPRYPLDYKVIQNLGKYNLVSIYNIVQNDVRYLLDAIESSEVLGLKGSMDKIPEKEILRDYNLQTTYFSKISSDILPRKFYGGFLLDKERQSYLFKTFGYYVPQGNRESSLIYEYSLYVLMLRNLRNSLRIYESAFSNSNPIILKNTEFSDSFGEYIERNKKNLAEKLIRYILEYTYKISEPSPGFLNNIINAVVNKLSELKGVFEDGIKIKDNVCVNLVLRGTEYLYNYIASRFANSAAGGELNFIPSDTIKTLKKFELFGEDPEDPINYKYITDKYSIQAFRQYLYLVYYYKNSPRKFLNILQLTLLAYTTQNMIDRKIPTFNTSVLLSYFRRVLGTATSKSSNGVDVDLIVSYLKEIITKEYLLSIIIDQKIVEYTVRIEMINYIEEILSPNNPDFEKYIDELYDLIFNYLKNSVQIEPYYEYCFNKKMLHWYLLGCIKRDTLKDNIIEKDKTTGEEKITWMNVFDKEEKVISKIFNDTLNSEKYDPESEKYVVKFIPDKMRVRAIQYIEGNITNIGNLFDNILETAAEKKLHSENISYFFS